MITNLRLCSLSDCDCWAYGFRHNGTFHMQTDFWTRSEALKAALAHIELLTA